MACALAAGVALVACGGGEKEEDRVAAAVEGMQEDLAAGRLSAVCAAMTDRPKVQIGSVGHLRKPTTCPRDLDSYLDGIEESSAAYGKRESLRRAARPRVVDVRIDASGRRATATLDVGSGPYEAPLVKQGDRWRLNDFFGAVGPPPRALR